MRRWIASVIVVAGCGFEGGRGGAGDGGIDPTGDGSTMDDASNGADAKDPPQDATAGTITVASMASATTSGDQLVMAANVEPGMTFLIGIATKRYRDVTAVAGLGATWTQVGDQCGAREQTGVALFIGRGATTTGNVIATIPSTSAPAQNAAGVLVGFKGVASTGATVRFNTASDLTCDDSRDSGMFDNVGYTVPIASRVTSTIVAAVATRDATHTPGDNYDEILAAKRASGGDAAGVAVMQGTGMTIDGSFSQSVDFAVVGIELRP